MIGFLAYNRRPARQAKAKLKEKMGACESPPPPSVAAGASVVGAAVSGSSNVMVYSKVPRGVPFTVVLFCIRRLSSMFLPLKMDTVGAGGGSLFTRTSWRRPLPTPMRQSPERVRVSSVVKKLPMMVVSTVQSVPLGSVQSAVVNPFNTLPFSIAIEVIPVLACVRSKLYTESRVIPEAVVSVNSIQNLRLPPGSMGAGVTT